MKKLLTFGAVLLGAAIPGRAQDNYPGFEIFRGYSHLNLDALNRGNPASSSSWAAGRGPSGSLLLNCVRAMD